MKKIQNKVELRQNIEDLVQQYRVIKKGMNILCTQITEANITMGVLDEALNKLKDSEITTELIVTEETKTEPSKRNTIKYIIIFLCGGIIGVLLVLFKIF